MNPSIGANNSPPKPSMLVTVEDLLDSLMSWRKDFIGVATEMEVSPAIYRKISKIVHPESKKLDVATFYGMKIKIDPSLDPGEWRLKK